ncbi:thiolase C-terminal domain-containing protein [Microbacterium sp. A93]|uniref:thiolase C-terminal domain-containing protein n=1 Tax=Microbacterium sp. A93 TaxID=3450716 RepID=UPI003F42B45C
MTHSDREIVISGVGETAYGRNTGVSGKKYVLQAAVAACVDAGVAPESIDGVIAYRTCTVEDYVNSLGIRDLRFHSVLYHAMGAAGHASALGLAADVIRSGRASRVLVSGGGSKADGGPKLSDPTGKVMSGEQRLAGGDIRRHIEFPSGISVPMQWHSFHANRWMHEFKPAPGGMKTVALETRRHAQNNEKAYFRGRELTSEMYDETPLLTAPFRLFDISMESDGAGAVIVESAAAAAERSRRPVYIAGAAEGQPDSPDDQTGRQDFFTMGITKAAARLFDQLGVKPKDFDFAEVYDCFTFVVLRQLEEMGFCGRGESPDFVREIGIGPGGGLPVNTHGGLLSQAHIGGINHIVEAVRQLRGEAGPAQVPGAQLGLVTGFGQFGKGSLAVLHN